ncbi:MAG TPA: dihydrofolate reductase [Polyangia bacterium]|nr:dihydrofolate reductase [Polyangia bacterium]
MTRSIIAAVAKNGVIGAGNQIPWRLPADLKRFKALTMGHSMIMGRKTFESIGRALPGRTTIVLTQHDWAAPEGVLVARSIGEALALARGDEVFIAGGAEIYRQTLPIAERAYLTLLDREFPGDTFFPETDWSAWRVVERERHEASETNALAFEFVTYEK